MDRINRILYHEIYRECYGKNVECEKERIFCHHDMGHFLDVARLALIINLQEQMGISQELIYGAALLHDIGRFRQYLEGIPHEIASAEIAPDILRDCGFDDTETREITDAIRQHRNPDIKGERSLSGVIYRGDKMSRSCFACPAEKMCNWKKEKKNLQIKL
ncbi:MAG: HD domain-containing protein [Eubacteriales bacterium]|nr:HD domain-containing protein [Eubacteriales bacterium]